MQSDLQVERARDKVQSVVINGFSELVRVRELLPSSEQDFFVVAFFNERPRSMTTLFLRCHFAG